MSHNTHSLPHAGLVNSPLADLAIDNETPCRTERHGYSARVGRAIAII